LEQPRQRKIDVRFGMWNARKVYRVLRRIFEPKREEVAGGWGTLHNEELNNLYASPNIIRGDQIKKYEMGGACSTHGRDEQYYIQYFGLKIGLIWLVLLNTVMKLQSFLTS